MYTCAFSTPDFVAVVSLAANFEASAKAKSYFDQIPPLKKLNWTSACPSCEGRKAR